MTKAIWKWKLKKLKIESEERCWKHLLQLKMLAMIPGLIHYVTVSSAISQTSNVSFARQTQDLHFIAINCKFCFSCFTLSWVIFHSFIEHLVLDNFVLLQLDCQHQHWHKCWEYIMHYEMLHLQLNCNYIHIPMTFFFICSPYLETHVHSP